LSNKELCDTKLEEGGELNVQGMCKPQRSKNVERRRQEEHFVPHAKVIEES